MNPEEIASSLKNLRSDLSYRGLLTDYAVHSIENAKSNYPVSNLIQYCKDRGIVMELQDGVTLDKFYPETILQVHDVLRLLMDRFQIDAKTVYRKTGVNYTFPNNKQAPLSIKTLLAVCETLHCKLSFKMN